MRSAQPEKHLQAEHYQREANGPFVVSASAAVIAPSHIKGAQEAADQQGDAEDLGNLFPQSLVGLLDALRLGPITDEREVDWSASERGRLHTERPCGTRPNPSPSHARVRGSKRVPLRLHLLKLGYIKSSLIEQQIPVQGSTRGG